MIARVTPQHEFERMATARAVNVALEFEAKSETMHQIDSGSVSSSGVHASIECPEANKNLGSSADKGRGRQSNDEARQPRKSGTLSKANGNGGGSSSGPKETSKEVTAGQAQQEFGCAPRQSVERDSLVRVLRGGLRHGQVRSPQRRSSPWPGRCKLGSSQIFSFRVFELWHAQKSAGG